MFKIWNHSLRECVIETKDVVVGLSIFLKSFLHVKKKKHKEDVVHVYNGILLSHKKEWNWAICRDVDESRDCHTESSTSEREKRISYINAYSWNLEKWYRWTSLQGRNWDTDVENKRTDTKGGKRLGVGVGVWWIERLGLTIYTLICIKWVTNKNLLHKKINTVLSLISVI